MGPGGGGEKSPKVTNNPVQDMLSAINMSRIHVSKH